MNKIVNLHTNSEYSFLQSAIKLKNLIDFAKKNDLDVLTLTDHNNMFGAVEFYNLCKQNNIKPIIGLDLDVENFRLILLAKNYLGYLELVRLSSQKMTNNEININDILIDNLIIIDHPTFGCKNINNKKIDIKNAYYLGNDPNDSQAIFIQDNKILTDDDNKILSAFYKIENQVDKEFQYKTFPIEINNINETILNRTNSISEQINLEFPKFNIENLPQFDANINSNELLRKKVYENMKLFKNKLIQYPDYLERINYELEVIEKLNYANYFLIIQDIIAFAKENNISVGPARGSSAGSLVSFILKITTINPLKYDLIFERFLNIQRITMPDIDIDFQDDRRDEIVTYIINKYGYQNVALISTFQRIGAKMAIRDIGRGLGFKVSEINEISKTLKNNETLDDAYKSNIYFQKIFVNNDDEKYLNLLYLSKKIEGFPRQVGTHAAGIIISKNPLNTQIPVLLSSGNMLQSQFSMEYLEMFNIWKIDLLGLRTLTTIKNIENQIKKRNNDDFYEDMKNDLFLKNIHKYLDNNRTNELLNNGNVLGIFQLESPGMTKTISKVHVDEFNDIVDIISLFRPGPMAYINDYVANKKDKSKIEKIEPIYDEIISKTNGIIIYQEQIMNIVQKYAKLNFAEADILRRAISKKNSDDILHFRNIFLDSAKKNGKDEKTSEKIFDKFEAFALYGFNKSHAVAYATLSYYMAQLKANFPVEFYTALLSSSDSQDVTNHYVTEAKNIGLQVESPDINFSNKEAVFKNGAIYLPFNFIKGLGNANEDKIINERSKNGPYSSFYEMVQRLNFVNVGENILTKIILTNCLRNFNDKNSENKPNNSKVFVENLNSALAYSEINKIKDSDGNIQMTKNMPARELIFYEKNILFDMKNELELLGMIYNAYPTKEYETNNKLNNLKNNEITLVTVLIEDVEMKTSYKTKIKFLKIVISDSTCKLFLTLFGNLDYWSQLKVGQIVDISIKKFTNKDNQIDYQLSQQFVVKTTLKI